MYRPCDELMTRPRSPTVCKMIKKLRNQPYAPKWEQEEREKKYRLCEISASTSILSLSHLLPTDFSDKKKISLTRVRRKHLFFQQSYLYNYIQITTTLISNANS
jgi:hypothetical protein